MIIRNTCRRCYPTIRRSYSTFDHGTVQLSDSSHAAVPDHQAKLSTRSLVALHGIDVPHFLQGITTNNIRPSQTEGFYSAFLTAQGRVLHDVFIYPAGHSRHYLSTLAEKLDKRDPAYIIEVDANERSKLISHIKKYKLRAKFDVRPLAPGDFDVWSVWNADAGWTPGPDPDFNQSHFGDIGCVDPRAPGMGFRSIVSEQFLPRPTDGQALTVPEKDYRVRRIMNGVPEGQAEIFNGAALPAESNIDYMGGIDFRKGCYVGQELTIRTHHTGVVRKRILPVQLYASDKSAMPANLSFEEDEMLRLPSQGANISKAGVEGKGRSAGKWLDGIGNLGLALCRLETMTDTVLTGETGQWSPTQEFKIELEGAESQNGGEIKVMAFMPAWHKHRGVLGEKV